MGSVDVEIGRGRRMEASRALMIYRDGGFGPRSIYAVHAEAVTGEGGKVQLGPWEPVTMEFVQQLARQLGADLPREILPARVLCRTHNVVLWWTPPGMRTLFFDAEKLASISGEDFPVPALVWKLDLTAGRLYLRAMAGADRPGPEARLYVAPFLNVYNEKPLGGLVCQGTMRRPDRIGIDALGDWERGFFNASGSSQLTPRATTLDGQLLALWPELVGKNEFPGELLLEAGESLAKFAKAGEDAR